MEPSISDEAVLAMANQHKALLLTVDKDFGELVFRQQHISEGVILIRLAGLSPTSKARVVSAVINDHADELGQAFTVISPGMVRIRPRRTTIGLHSILENLIQLYFDFMYLRS
jgi:predicted nuclease of predicted toxin-antitoxin system